MIAPEVWVLGGVMASGLATIIVGQVNARAAHSKAQLEVKLAMADNNIKLDEVVDRIDVRLSVLERVMADHLAQHGTQPIAVQQPRHGLRAVRQRKGDAR